MNVAVLEIVCIFRKSNFTSLSGCKNNRVLLEQLQEYLRLLIQSIMLHYWHLWHYVWKSSNEVCTGLTLWAFASTVRVQKIVFFIKNYISLQHFQHPVQSQILNFYDLGE